MAKVGRFVTDPRAGSYCQITLDQGGKLLVSHERTGRLGKVTVAAVKLWGLSSEALLDCSLDSAEGQSLLARLTAGAAPGSAGATPLGALVNHLRDCDGLDAVRARCRALLSGASRPG